MQTSVRRRVGYRVWAGITQAPVDIEAFAEVRFGTVAGPVPPVQAANPGAGGYGQRHEALAGRA